MGKAIATCEKHISSSKLQKGVAKSRKDTKTNHKETIVS
jgi:hypothetical protein